MRYKKFEVEKYKAVKNSLIPVSNELIPIIGVNESGKSSALEAIAHFDYRNDQLAITRNWKFINRYKPSEKEFFVCADIEIESDVVETILQNFSEAEQTEIRSSLGTFDALEIKRSFRAKEKPYAHYVINGKEGDLVERFSKEVIGRLPRVFYFDNFLENPFPDEILIPAAYIADTNYKLDEHASVIERMFACANVKLRDFLKETDQSSKATDISEVNKFATGKIIKDWDDMHVSLQELGIDPRINVSIHLSQTHSDNNPYKLNLSIKEEFQDPDGEPANTFMNLSERSLGFRWFFNFSAKKHFGVTEGEKLIYLFDEPGSYLHNGAQDVLLKVMKDLAMAHPVIFSTHSEFLLNPEVVNINNIKIAEKRNREIKLTPFAQVKDKKKLGALSTLHNALRSRIAITNTLDQKIIITEGITDFYFWKMLTKKITFLPGFGAGSNEYLISLAIGTAKRYLAFFDGDRSGKDAIEKYKRYFGEPEEINWKVYLNQKQEEIQLESILSKNDQERLLSLTEAKDLKKAITALFFSADKIEQFWNGIDSDTIANVNENIKMIKTALNISSTETYFNYRLGE